MGQWLYLKGKLKLIYGGEVKSNINSIFLVFWIKPETKWSNHEQVDDIKVV